MTKKYEILYNEEKKENSILKKKINYLEAKNNTLINKKNKGERDEVLLLIELFHLNETGQFDKLIVIFGEEASDGISILNMDTDDEIVDINNLSKAGACYKADCKIKMKKTSNIYTPSIKSKNGANPALLNHTPRSAAVFQKNGILNAVIIYIDKIITEYKYKRKNKIIQEDTTINNLECLNDNKLKEIFINVLRYFVFDGSGKGYSKCRANSIIEYENGEINFIKCDNLEKQRAYIISIYNRIVLSLRSKGMPNPKRKIKCEYCEPWIFKDVKSDGTIKLKGSLHIRIK